MYIFLLFVYLEGKAFCKGIAFSVGEAGPKLKKWLPVLIFSFLNLNLTVHRTLNTHTVVVTCKPESFVVTTDENPTQQTSEGGETPF